MGALNPRVFILTLFLSKGEHLVLIFPKVLEFPEKNLFWCKYWREIAIYYWQFFVFSPLAKLDKKLALLSLRKSGQITQISLDWLSKLQASS